MRCDATHARLNVPPPLPQLNTTANIMSFRNTIQFDNILRVACPIPDTPLGPVTAPPNTTLALEDDGRVSYQRAGFSDEKMIRVHAHPTGAVGVDPRNSTCAKPNMELW